MTRIPSLLLVVLSVVAFCNVSARTVKYTVTFVGCVWTESCPEGNPTKFNATFAVNDIISPKLYLYEGDKLVFNLATDVPIHPLTICQNSLIPNYCAGSNGTDILNIPITKAGDTTSATLTVAGTYYYGCNYHPGMGATIIVFPNSAARSSSSAKLSIGSSSRIVSNALKRIRHQ